MTSSISSSTQATGIRAVWIIDLVAEKVLIYEDGQFQSVIHRGEGRALRTDTVPEVVVDVDEMFSAALGG